jgi:hypothetical protein
MLWQTSSREGAGRPLARSLRRVLVGAVLAIPVASGVTPALAQPATPPAVPSMAASAAPAAPPSAPVLDAAATEEVKTRAGDSRKRAKKLFDKGAYSAALGEYQAAFRIFPTWSARTGAGGCLIKLQRYDEALDVFEGTLAEQGASLPVKTREEVLRQIDTMRTVVGGISISGAEIGAIITLDGRVRGEHPTVAPLNVLVGPHLLRIYKEGFELFETSVETTKSQVTAVPARLVPLASARSGRLKIEEIGGKKMEIVVDGVPVGVTPWEGSTTAGEHSIVLRPIPDPAPPPPPEDSICNAPLPAAQRAAMRGTADVTATLPTTVVVKANQITGVKLKAEPLTASLKIRPDPATARLFVDGSAVGRGGFEGRIKPGSHVVKVEAEGYFSEDQEITIATGDDKALAVKLRKDLDSPVWARTGHFTLELSGSVPLAPSFGGQLAASCQVGCRQGVGIGGRGMLRGGYELGNGLGFGITAGYLEMQQSVTGREATFRPKDPAGKALTGIANDTVAIRDFMLGAYGALRLGKRFPVHVGLAAGVALGNISDTRTGLFNDSAVGPVTQSAFFTWIFVEPELRVGVHLTEHLGLGVSLSGLLLVAPRVPQWNPTLVLDPHGKELGQGAGGQNRLGYFDAETITGSAIFAVTESVSVHYDF